MAGVAVGQTSGSQVIMNPNVGQTVWSSAHASIGTITAVLQLPSGAASESMPAWLATVVFNPGGAAEQIITALFGGMGSAGTCAALWMDSLSADSSLATTIYTMNVVPNAHGATWAATFYTQLLP
jgi:hypothetical protein